MTVTGLGTKRKRRSSLPILPVVSGLMVLAAVALFTIELIGFSQQQVRLPADVTVASLPVGGLLPREAVSRWEQAFAQPVVLYYENSPILLDPASVGFRTNSQPMLAAAGAAGDVEAGFWTRFFNHLAGQEDQEAAEIPLSAEYQEGLLQQFLADVSVRYDLPASTAGFDVNTLTLRPGAGGYVLDREEAFRRVDTALRSATDRVVKLPTSGEGAQGANIDTLRDMIIAYLDSQGFIYDGQTTVASVYIQDLQTGEEVSILSDVAFSAASTIKVAILADYFRTLSFAPTSDEAWLMANSLLCSNNASSNLIMQIIGGNDIFRGIADVTSTVGFVGARNTYITAPFYLGVEGQDLGSIGAPQTAPNPNYITGADPFNQTTTEDLGTLFMMIYDCANYGSGLMAAFPNGEYTQTECRQMLELMSANDLERLLQGGVPIDVRISHKNGWLENVHGDAGIVYSPNGRNYVIAVFVWENVEFFSFDRAWPLIEGISRATWNYFNPETPLIAPRTDLPETAQECVGNFLPPDPQSVDLNNINGWRNGTTAGGGAG